MALIITAFAPRSTDQFTTSIKARAQNQRPSGAMVGTADDAGGKWYILSMITPTVDVKR
jgi:hypothetical protein